MKKIKKQNPKSAQSVHEFACPCAAPCYTGCSNNRHYLSLDTAVVPGMQTVNY